MPESSLLSAALTALGPVPQSLLDAAAGTAERDGDENLLIALLRRPEVGAELATRLARRGVGRPRVTAAQLARPEWAPDVAARQAATSRERAVARALADEPYARDDLLLELAGHHRGALPVLARRGAPVAARLRALRTLDQHLHTSTGDRNRSDVYDAVRRALRAEPIPAAALGTAVADIQAVGLLAELGRSPLPLRAQRRIATVCVDDQLRDIGVKTSDTANSRRQWVAATTAAIATGADPAVREKLARSWDRRGPRRSTQLAALPTTLAAKVRTATWSPQRWVEHLPLPELTRLADRDPQLAAALLTRLVEVCGDDRELWSLAGRLGGQLGGTTTDLQIALAGVRG